MYRSAAGPQPARRNKRPPHGQCLHIGAPIIGANPRAACCKMRLSYAPWRLFVSIFCFCASNGKIVAICTHTIRACIKGHSTFAVEMLRRQKALLPRAKLSGRRALLTELAWSQAKAGSWRLPTILIHEEVFDETCNPFQNHIGPGCCSPGWR